MTAATSFDVEQIRSQFPALHQTVHEKPLVYLDNAATPQKPLAVIDSINDYYEGYNANVHRGVHALSQRATVAFDAARVKVQHFLGASSPDEIVFTKGCTEAINLVAATYGRKVLKAGDVVLLSNMEHHADIVPWQLVCEAAGATIRVIPINDAGELDLDALEKMLDERVKIVGVVHISNALGTINPVAKVVAMAHAVGAKVLIDGAQACPHTKVDVKNLDVDFYTLSGHKAYGPTGIGALYAKRELLETMPPYQGGGDMIRTVSFEKTTYAEPPSKFEAGTPNIEGAIALGFALDWLRSLDPESVESYEKELISYGTALLSEINGLKIIGTAKNKTGILSFVMDCAHPHDIGTILDLQGVAIRAGHHCCMPLMKRLGVPATARASLAIYTTKRDLDILAKSLKMVSQVFRK